MNNGSLSLVRALYFSVYVFSSSTGVWHVWCSYGYPSQTDEASECFCFKIINWAALSLIANTYHFYKSVNVEAEKPQLQTVWLSSTDVYRGDDYAAQAKRFFTKLIENEGDKQSHGATSMSTQLSNI